MTDYSKKILFTGAGFSKNFGGVLAKEMWSLIFNTPEIQNHKRLCSEMLKNFDFEAVYGKVRHEFMKDVLGGFTSGKPMSFAFSEALKKAYKDLDDKIRTHQQIADICKLRNFIKEFYERGKINCFFTLNQDLFIERFRSTDMPPMTLPGGVRMIQIEQREFSNDEDRVLISDTVERNLDADIFNYIKLHGSFNWWKATESGQETNIMVIGTDKKKRIGLEPLLDWYSTIFENVLEQGGCRLFIIGYGFQDEHINETIAKSVKDHDLKIYVIDTKSPSDFHDQMSKKETCKQIYEGPSQELCKLNLLH